MTQTVSELLRQDTTPSGTSLEYYTGLDLGQSKDPSALIILERSVPPASDDGLMPAAKYALRHIRRWPLGTNYVEVIDEVKQLFEKPPLPKTTLVVDRTGCGRPVFDMLTRSGISARTRGITITAGYAPGGSRT